MHSCGDRQKNDPTTAKDTLSWTGRVEHVAAHHRSVQPHLASLLGGLTKLVDFFRNTSQSTNPQR